jgi:hypothetical protein
LLEVRKCEERAVREAGGIGGDQLLRDQRNLLDCGLRISACGYGALSLMSDC